MIDATLLLQQVGHRSPLLTEEERTIISYAVAHAGIRSALTYHAGVPELLYPMQQTLAGVGIAAPEHYYAGRILLQEMLVRNRAYWAWTREEWATTIGQTRADFTQRHGAVGPKARQHVLVVAYWLAHIDEFVTDPASDVMLARAAANIFGPATLDSAVTTVCAILQQRGYGQQPVMTRVRLALAHLFLARRSGHLADISLALLQHQQAVAQTAEIAAGMGLVSQGLAELGIITTGLPWRRERAPLVARLQMAEVAPDWIAWATAWVQHSLLTERTKATCVYYLGKVGVWLARTHPAVTSPEHWDDAVALDFVAALSVMKVGEFAQKRRPDQVARWGKELSPRTKDHTLFVLRRFFLDLQELPHAVGDASPRRLPRRFNPLRLFQTPRALRQLIGPDPRIIEDAWWWKILQAAVELTEADLAHTSGGSVHYPLAMVRAVALTWCFSALRGDEIRRLRVGAIRWQWEEEMSLPEGDLPPADATCFLYVPVNKTWTAFWKPVYALVGRAIQAWEAVRPPQPRTLDQKTNEFVDVLFAYRGHGLGPKYLNDALIPMLCRKAGIPPTDARGRITGHRARATIATMYYNCPEGLTGAELQEFLGHADFRSTRSYIKANPTKLAKSVARANKNSRLVNVIIDPQAAVQGEPAIFYEFGDGTLCGNPAWAACPHRMACIKCPMHVGVDLAQVIRARAGILRMLQEVPDLTEEERAAAEGDRVMLERLLQQHQEMPPPPVPNDQYRFTPRTVKKVLPMLPSQ